jgi:hypothetical protein
MRRSRPKPTLALLKITFDLDEFNKMLTQPSVVEQALKFKGGHTAAQRTAHAGVFS